MNFADKYAEAALGPSGDLIELRQATLAKVPKDLRPEQVLSLCRFYYGLEGAEVSWFVDLLRDDDPSFSLLANRREMVLLTAVVLSERIAAGFAFDLLAVLVTSAMDSRQPEVAAWLVAEAKQQILEQAVANRRAPVRSTISRPATSKLGDEIKTSGDEWEAQRSNAVKVRAEAFNWAANVASQAGAATAQLYGQLQLLQEETNILWWLFGETSDLLNEHYSTLSTGAADLVAGFDLAALTTSSLGPVSVDAMMSRMVRLSKKTRSKSTLSTIVEGLSEDQIGLIGLERIGGHDDIFIMHTALQLVGEIGAGAWQSAFVKRTAFNPEQTLDLQSVRLHAYREYLLARLSGQ